MAVPQGSTIFPTAYITALINRINAASSCAELQALVTNEFTTNLQGLSSALKSQYAAIAPIVEFVEAGAPAANPDAIVTWINTFLSLMGLPYVIPYATIVAQQAELTAAVSSLTSAIESAQARFTHCSITVPPIT